MKGLRLPKSVPLGHPICDGVPYHDFVARLGPIPCVTCAHPGCEFFATEAEFKKLVRSSRISYLGGK